MAKELGEKQLFIVTIVVFAVVLVGLGVFSYMSYRKYDTLTATNAQLDKEIDEFQKVIDKEPDLEKELKQSEDRFTAVQEYLPKDKDVRRLLDDFAQKCRDANLENLKMAPEVNRTAARGKKAGAGDYETLRYKCEFGGSLHSLAKFVSLVENWKDFKRFVNITEFEIVAQSGGMAFDNDLQKHSIKLTLDLYKYNEPQKAARAPRPAAGGTGG